ncbi:hypothetical protein ACNKHL_05930 [Shigella flexneri]
MQWAHGKPLNVLLMPGPDNAGGSKEMVRVFAQPLPEARVRIVDIAFGDNDIEIQRNLLQRCWNTTQKSTSYQERPLRAEAAMGEGG